MEERPDEKKQIDFIRKIIDEHNVNGRFGGRVHTRFPPEPNGYLHIGHAKSIHLNSSIARDYGGLFNLRFDDTNPCKEEMEYVESIIEDVRWLGADWEDRMFFASDYFERLYEYAEQLIEMGKAYVCDLSADEIREYRGTLTEPGVDSPFRNRSVAENLDLFRRMRAGEFPDGSRTLRAKIDMASPNLNMRDPVTYRILHAEHHRTGDKWCIYPMYDFTHCLSDSIEGITHSLCTLEFEDHRPLYDWYLDQLGVYHPQQIEFARLNMTHTVMSKRRLLMLVKSGIVSGWDDPRMPTLAAIRRRGYTPGIIHRFMDLIGIAKADSIVDISLLEHCAREQFNRELNRVMVVLRPLRVVIDNYPSGKVELLDALNNPEDPSVGTRTMPFSREIFIECDDFRVDPPKKYFRLSPGAEVRLKHAYYITCTGYETDADGNVTTVHCDYDPESRGGDTPDGRVVRGTLHFVSAAHARPATVRLYENLLTVSNPVDIPPDRDFREFINPDSVEILDNCLMEPFLEGVQPGDRFQFMRHGYFIADSDSTPERPVFNRTVTLRDTWAKIAMKNSGTE